MVKEKTVTKIEVQKRNPKRRSVFIDGEFAFGLDEEVLHKSGLKKGESLTQPRIDEITEEEYLQGEEILLDRLRIIRERQAAELEP